MIKEIYKDLKKNVQMEAKCTNGSAILNWQRQYQAQKWVKCILMHGKGVKKICSCTRVGEVQGMKLV